MQIDRAIHLRNGVLSLTGLAYSALGLIFWLRPSWISEALALSPLLLLATGFGWIGFAYRRNRAILDERTRARLYGFVTLAFVLVALATGAALQFMSENDLISTHLVAGIVNLGFGLPMLLFGLSEWLER